ncbi:MAG: outer membrane lipoprotein-sorting protein [Pseudomonadales bacterium]
MIKKQKSFASFLAAIFLSLSGEVFSSSPSILVENEAVEFSKEQNKQPSPLEKPSLVNESNDQPLTAENIMELVDQRYDGDTKKQYGRLTLIDKRKNKRVRNIFQLSKIYGEDKRVITQVLSPSEVSGTTILAYEWDEVKREDETWLYLPQLRKVKRLATTDKSSYFLGSDFTYSDLSGLEVEDFSYEFINNESTNEQWVLFAKPKKDIGSIVIDKTGYIKIKYWIDKEKMMIVKAKYWLKDGSKVKYYNVSGFDKIDDIWIFRRAQMVLSQGKKMLHASIFEIDTVEYNHKVKDEMFTTYAMERKIE